MGYVEFLACFGGSSGFVGGWENLGYVLEFVGLLIIRMFEVRRR